MTLGGQTLGLISNRYVSVVLLPRL